MSSRAHSGAHRDLVDAAAHLLELAERGSIERIGVGRVETDGGIDRVFLQNAGLALDGETVRIVDETGWRPRIGDLAYVACFLGGLRTIRKRRGPQLVVDGSLAAWWVTVAKADPIKYWGSRGFRTTPRARRNRGINILAARSAGYARTAKWGVQALFSGKHVRHPDLAYIEDVRSCAIRARSPVALQVDGEYLGRVGDTRFSAVPDAIPVFRIPRRG